MLYRRLKWVSFFWLLAGLVGLFGLESADALKTVPNDGGERSVQASSPSSNPTTSLDGTLGEVRRQMEASSSVRSESGEKRNLDLGKQGTNLFSVVTKLVYALLFVIFILVVGLYVLRRFLQIRAPGSSRYIQVVSRMSLSPKSSLHLVRVLNKRLLIGEGPEGIRLIAEIPEGDGAIIAAEPDASAEPMTRGEFRKRLEGEMNTVQKGMLSERLSDLVSTCREYVGRFKAGGGRNE